jgi:glyceraldehyde-3-phosphate dehydrogenase (NADP+)
VMQSVADDLVKKVVEKMNKLTVGYPNADCDITPVISETSAEFIQGLVEDARDKGARFHQVHILLP